jgi:hypothetical protein
VRATLCGYQRFPMMICCPEGHGCNAPAREPCALALFAAEELPEAAAAQDRWRAWERSRRDRGAERFARRAYERARDKALIAIAIAGSRTARTATRRGEARARPAV